MKLITLNTDLSAHIVRNVIKLLLHIDVLENELSKPSLRMRKLIVFESKNTTIVLFCENYIIACSLSFLS